MEFRILGSLEVEQAGQAIPLGGPRQQAVLVALLLHAGDTVSVDQLIDAVWADAAPPSAANTLHGYIHHLRALLEPERQKGQPSTVVTSEPGGYRLRVTPDMVDAARFERLADHGRRQLDAGDPRRAAATLGAALGLWRSDPLASFADLDAVRVEMVRLRERRVQVVEDHVDALLEIGDMPGALAMLEDVLAAEPWREHLWEQRMTALYRSGRQADALAAYAEFRESMRDELGLDPGRRLQELELRILDHDPTLDPSQTVSPADRHQPGLAHQTTSFVGRTGDVARLVEALRSSRLVTVIGPGGVGKTRLVVETLAGPSSPHVGDCWFVDLAELDRDAHLADAVADAVSTDDLAKGSESARSRLEGQLRAVPSTLVLDNVEHVIAAAADLVDHLLARCPELRVVTTSREALVIDGENLVALSPLAIDEAAELFADRALASRRDFDQHEHGAQIKRVCESLDGVPLAIELAAARLRSLPMTELTERISDQLKVLTGGSRARLSRQRTLEATIGWSFDLLDDLESIAYSRLAVFSGGFDLASAEHVLAGEPIATHDVMDLVGQLVDKSLVVMNPSTGRYRMLETIRAYAVERLAELGSDSEETRRRHAHWFTDRLGDSTTDLGSGGRTEAVESVERDIANYRAAFNWAIDADPTVATTLAANLGSWWELRGLLDEGRSCLEAAWETGAGSELDRCRIRLAVGFIARRQGDLATAITASRDALAGFRTLDEPMHLAHALGRMSWVWLGAGDHAHAVELAHEGLALSERLDDAEIAAWMRLSLGHAAHERGDLDEALTQLMTARDQFRVADARSGLGRALFHLALIALERGELRGALAAAVEAVDITHAAHDVNGTVMAVEVVAQVASAGGAHETAAQLTAATESLRSVTGAQGHDGHGHGAAVDEAVTGLEPAEIDRARAAGRRLDLDAMVDLVHQLGDNDAIS